MPIPTSVWGSRQYLRATLEDEPGTRKTTPGTGEQIWIPITGDNGFSMVKAPSMYEIFSAHSLNESITVDSQLLNTTGSLTVPFYPSQAAFMLAQVADIVSTGTPPVYRKKTMTLDYFNGVNTESYLGVHVQKATLTAKANAGAASWSLNLVAWKPEDSPTALASPAPTVFPTDKPFRLTHTKGLLKVGSTTALVQYNSITMNWENTLAVEACEDENPDIAYGGRKVSFSFDQKFKSTTQQLAYEGVTTSATNEVTFTRADVGSVKFDFNSKVHFSAFSRSHPLGGSAMQTITGMARFDASNSPAGSFEYVITGP